MEFIEGTQQRIKTYNIKTRTSVEISEVKVLSRKNLLKIGS